ncbi:Tigr01456 family had hydrolase, partial [Globisporangium splendens]
MLSSWMLLRRAPARQTRTISSSTSAPSFGIAFDIDGVLVRGGKELPRARRVLQSLRENNVPHIFLTNGGGCMEEAKAANLSKTLDWQIDPQHMILSHTPMREIASVYGDKRVLIMGSHDVYTVYPFHKYEQKYAMHLKPALLQAPFHDEPVEAIIIMHDPIDWAPEIQVAVDVLIGGNPPGSGQDCGTQTPLFVSNDDFVFSGAYPFPRFAQGAMRLKECFCAKWSGAFTKCLTLLYEERTGKPLEVTRYGKPHNVTYKYECAFALLGFLLRQLRILQLTFLPSFPISCNSYAENLLNKIAGRGPSNPLTSMYGIGDNPHADIQGANNAGDRWSSILVRTGIYDGTIPPAHTPDVISNDVFDAITYIYEQEGLDPSSLL